MPNRPSKDWPRLPGRPQLSAPISPPPNTNVFRRFFDLIERLEKPRGAPGTAAPFRKAGVPAEKGRS